MDSLVSSHFQNEKPFLKAGRLAPVVTKCAAMDAYYLSSYTCCPDLAGCCPSNEYCSLGDDGEYGCCPGGELCTGDGGAITSFSYESTSTRTTTRRVTSTSVPMGDEDPLSWRTYTVTYADGDVSALSYALYEGGYVTNSDELEWETTKRTFSDGDVTVATYVSYPQDGSADYLDWVTVTATANGAVTTTAMPTMKVVQSPIPTSLVGRQGPGPSAMEMLRLLRLSPTVKPLRATGRNPRRHPESP